MDNPIKLKRIKTEMRVGIIYLALGVLWIIFSDAILSAIADNLNLINKLQTFKGITFVAITTLIIYLLIRKESLKQYSILKTIEHKENEFRQIVNSQNDLLVKVDTKGRFLFVNDSYCDFFGKSREELIGYSFMPFIHEDDRLPTTKAMEKLYKAPHKAHFEQRVQTPNGWRILFWNDIAVLNNKNEVVEIIGHGRDITDEKKTHEKLLESEMRYRRLFEKSNDPILIIEGNKFIDCNSATFALLGYSNKKDIIGKSPDELSPEKQPDGITSLSKAESIITQTLKDGYKRFEWVHEDVNGKPIWVEVALTSMKDRGSDVIFTLWRDISKRKLIEQELKESQENFKHIAEHTSDFILIVNENFVAKYVSPSVKNVLGFTEKEISDKSILEFIHDEEIENIKKRIFEERLSHTKSSTFINRAKTKDGRTIWIELSIERIFNMEGSIDYSVCIGRDASERIKYENELKIALNKAKESDKLKSAFLANMSHEIRTPLNGIIGFSEILATDEDIDKDSRLNYTEIIKKSSNQLLTIISDILDISKIESQQIEISIVTISVKTLLNDMHTTHNKFAVKKGLELLIENSDDDNEPMIFGDSQRTRQIFSNLISNAIKFTSSGKITLGYNINNNTCIFYVKDTGIGIKETNINTVFERFMQVDNNAVKYGGTGLGLSICRSLLELMQGEIWVSSEFGKGSTFYFSLPKAP